MRKLLVFIIFAAVVPCLAVPLGIHYQGTLTRIDGSQLDTIVAMTFRCYDAVTGGTMLWMETQPTCTVRAGQFHVVLGATTTIPDIFSHHNVYLGTTVGSDSELFPRHRLLSVPYAYRVGTVDSSSGGYISGNLSISGGATLGPENLNENNYSFVAGTRDTATNGASAVIGYYNVCTGTHSVIAGGEFNRVTGGNSNVSGGHDNKGYAHESAIGGGVCNETNGVVCTIAGGVWNLASGEGPTIGGGGYNKARGDYSTVAGGGGSSPTDSNAAAGDYASIGGGRRNSASFQESTVSGGYANRAQANQATIGGGWGNTVSGSVSTVSGGWNNTVSGERSVISGGRDNLAGGYASTVAGGYGNRATGARAAVGGGQSCYARGDYSVVAGGGSSTLADSNSATGLGSAIGGGRNNRASGQYACVPGGTGNSAFGIGSFSAGMGAGSSGAGTFLWSDATGPIDANLVNAFIAKSSGGVYFISDSAQAIGVVLYPGETAWSSLGDVALMSNLRQIDTREILEKVQELTIQKWSFRGHDSSIAHIGPTAQDFWRQFHVGADSLRISTLDPDGVALAAIQELAKQNQQLQEELNVLRKRVQALEAAEQKTFMED